MYRSYIARYTRYNRIMWSCPWYPMPLDALLLQIVSPWRFRWIHFKRSARCSSFRYYFFFIASFRRQPPRIINSNNTMSAKTLWNLPQYPCTQANPWWFLKFTTPRPLLLIPPSVTIFNYNMSIIRSIIINFKNCWKTIRQYYFYCRYYHAW